MSLEIGSLVKLPSKIIKDELNIIVELLMASHGVVLTFAREMATRVQRALDAGCTAPIAGFQPGKTTHPARESNDRDISLMYY